MLNVRKECLIFRFDRCDNQTMTNTLRHRLDESIEEILACATFNMDMVGYGERLILAIVNHQGYGFVVLFLT